MTTPLWAILFLLFIPLLLAFTSDYFRIKQFGKFDNNNPRIQSAGLTGVGQRAWAAQQNAWEAIILYAPAALVAHVVGADAQQSAQAALLYCGARVLHALFYLLDLDKLRSLSFLVALGCVLWLFWLAGTA
ncbi:MAG: MAPEG family protein [Gammaproteobacteria bacterium]|nr:MAPEG family protein [Gammaproteobacteria bacterium]